MGPSGPTEKWPILTTDQVPAEITEKQPFLGFAEKRKWGSFFKKKRQNPLKGIYLGKGYFFFAQHCLVVAITWFWPRSVHFFGPKNSDFGPKIFFCHRILNFVNCPFIAHGETKKSSPTPRWGHRLPVMTLALSARRSFGPTRFARRLDNTWIDGQCSVDLINRPTQIKKRNF